MSTSISEIRRNITSENVDVLRQCLELVRRCLLQENERGKAAETRATVMLGLLGVIATLVIAGSENLPTNSEPDIGGWLLLACFVSCLLFLVRALFYAIRTISIAKRYRLEPSLVFDLQDSCQIYALHCEIAGLLWEYDQSIGSNSGKLFWLHRCQRNSYVAISILVLFGFVSIEALRHWIAVSSCIPIGFSVLFGLSFLFLDPIAEKSQGIWNK